MADGGDESHSNTTWRLRFTLKASRYVRSAAVLASVSLIFGAFVAPADAKKKRKPKPSTPPSPPACAPYTPGEAGAAAPTTVVTDAATAEAPIVVDITAPPGVPAGGGGVDGSPSTLHNVQVDTVNPSAGLYVKIEFSDRQDFDLYLDYADGSNAAASEDANAAANNGVYGTGSPEGGWESGTNFESVTGINTLDCAGYTADVVSYLTSGGAVKLSMWLGEIKVEPNAPE